MPFYFCPLRSGSSGNALLVQAGDTRVLVDAGLSGRSVERALSEIGAPPETLGAILITHEHSDHIAGVGVLSKRYGLPVYASEGTWLAMEHKPCVAGVSPQNRRAFRPGQDFYIRDLAVAPFSTPHDAAEPVGYALLYRGRKLCVATDLGHIAQGWMRALDHADLALIEANHDPDLLRRSRYPEALKRRILGKRGHLSNADCGAALVKLAEAGVTNVVLGHLSAETNLPELAFETVRASLEAGGLRVGQDLRVGLAWRDRIGGIYEID